MELTLVEYFSGIGLMRMGLEQEGWRVVFANDISQNKFEMYDDFFPGAKEHYVVNDVFNLDPAAIPLATLATCSFPCIDLSLAGNMNGMDGEHSSAFWGFRDILRSQGSSAPPFVLVENVLGWLSSNKGEDFRITVQALNEIGYACDVFVLDALRFTPQSRSRVFLVGIKHGNTDLGIERILKRPKSLLSDLLRKRLLVNKDLNWTYLDIPNPPPIKTKGLSKVVEKIDSQDQKWWSEEKVQKHLNMMSDTHRSRVEKLIQGEKVSYRTFYRRMRNGSQRAEVRRGDTAGCLRTAVGGSAKQFLIMAWRGNVKMRNMSPREYARLQGVPDVYRIEVSENQALTGFGDAVCVPVVSWIAKNVISRLLKKPEHREESQKTFSKVESAHQVRAGT